MISRRLKLNPNFAPLPSEPGEEFFANGIFEFNVSKMLSFIKAHPDIFPKETVALRDIPAIVTDGSDEATIARADLDNPVILAEISPGQFNLIDGHHRLARARREGRAAIPAYRIGPEHHTAFLTAKTSYESYVTY